MTRVWAVNSNDDSFSQHTLQASAHPDTTAECVIAADSEVMDRLGENGNDKPV